MTRMDFRHAYEFDPNSYRIQEAGGLLGRLQALMPKTLPNPDIGTSLNERPEYDPANYDPPQAGLIARLLSLQAEQSRYEPTPANNAQAQLAPQNPDFRQLSRAPRGGSVSMSAGVAPEPIAPLSEADEAQQAREASVAGWSHRLQ